MRRSRAAFCRSLNPAIWKNDLVWHKSKFRVDYKGEAVQVFCDRPGKKQGKPKSTGDETNANWT
jgi:hypothetical protein